MRRGLALATFVIGIISVLCGTAATVLGAVGMRVTKSEKQGE